MNKPTLIKIFFNSLRIRIVEEIIREEYFKQKMRCPIHLSIGQELSAACFGVLTKLNDFFISPHRSHAHYLAKKGDIKSFIAELHGKKSGCSGGRGGSMHLIDLKKGFWGSTAIVANTIPIGVGIAHSKKLKNEKGIVLIFLGDGAVEEGVFFESLNYSIINNLPCLFVCENNFYSVYTHILNRQKTTNVSSMLKGFDIKLFTTSDRNVVKSPYVINQAINYVRLKKLPAFIEIKTHRFFEHCGPMQDDHLGYRKSVKLITNYKSDPIETFRKILIDLKYLTKKEIFIYENTFQKKIKKIFNNIDLEPLPTKQDYLKYIFK